MNAVTQALRSKGALFALAVLAAAITGSGVTAALTASATPAPHPVRLVVHPAAAARAVKPVVPGAAPVKAAPVVQKLSATLVSATTDTVTVSGLGTVQGTPDVVDVALQVSVVRPTTGEALDAANAVVDKLLSTLRQHGVAPADVQSTGLSLSPNYDYSDNQQTLNGYQAGQSISARLRSADKRGEIISAAAGVSGNDVTINGLSFDLEDNAAYLAKAQVAAFAMAKATAGRYAGLAGRSLGRVITINQVTDQVSAPQPYANGAMASSGGAASSVPLAAGSQPVSVQVTVTWALR